MRIRDPFNLDSGSGMGKIRIGIRDNLPVSNHLVSISGAIPDRLCPALHPSLTWCKLLPRAGDMFSSGRQDTQYNFL